MRKFSYTIFLFLYSSLVNHQYKWGVRGNMELEQEMFELTF